MLGLNFLIGVFPIKSQVSTEAPENCFSNFSLVRSLRLSRRWVRGLSAYGHASVICMQAVRASAEVRITSRMKPELPPFGIVLVTTVCGEIASGRP